MNNADLAFETHALYAGRCRESEKRREYISLPYVKTKQTKRTTVKNV